MNITDCVHGRCTVERVTIKTSLKVNGGEGGGEEEKWAYRTPTDSASHRSQKNKQEL